MLKHTEGVVNDYLDESYSKIGEVIHKILEDFVAKWKKTKCGETEKN